MNRTKFKSGVVYDMAMPGETPKQQKERIGILTKYAIGDEYIFLDRHFSCGKEPTHRLAALRNVRNDHDEVLICYSWAKLVSCETDIKPLVKVIEELGIEVQFYKSSSRKLHPMVDYLDLKDEFNQRRTGVARSSYSLKGTRGRHSGIDDEQKAADFYNAFMRNVTADKPVSYKELARRSRRSYTAWKRYVRVGACMYAEDPYVLDPFDPSYNLKQVLDEINEDYWGMYYQSKL